MSAASSVGRSVAIAAFAAVLRCSSGNPRTLALASNASNRLTGQPPAETSWTVCATPESLTTKSAAVRPSTATPARLTPTSTRIASVLPVKRGGACWARGVASATIVATTAATSETRTRLFADSIPVLLELLVHRKIEPERIRPPRVCVRTDGAAPEQPLDDRAGFGSLTRAMENVRERKVGALAVRHRPDRIHVGARRRVELPRAFQDAAGNQRCEVLERRIRFGRKHLRGN